MGIRQNVSHSHVSYPVVIFLSDGEARFDEEAAYDLFRASVRLG
jgi:hypothetical protein